jgi:hypothetical protein
VGRASVIMAEPVRHATDGAAAPKGREILTEVICGEILTEVICDKGKELFAESVN